MNGGYIPLCPQMYKGDEGSKGGAEMTGEPYDTEGYVTARPLPCVREEHGEIREQAVKQHFAKINEELDELKAAVLREVTTRNNLDDLAVGVDDDTDTDIAEEAADTITAITTMLEALGIDAGMRDEAQRRVNERNRERGRL